MRLRIVRMAAILFAPVLAAAAARAEAPTPLDAPLAAGETTLVTCKTGDHFDTSSDLVREVYHYRLYLPSDYEGHDRNYPVMFIASPAGNAEMGALEEPLVRDRWIAAMLVESRNGAADWLPNFECAWDDLAARARVQPGAAFCTGFSGAGRLCSAWPSLRPGFRGMILQSAEPSGGRGFLTPGNEDMVIYGTFGTLDRSFLHAKRMRLFLPRRVARSVEIFDGEHEWAPPPVAARALDWVLEKAFVAREYDPALTDAYLWYFANRLAAWERLESGIERYVENAALQPLPALWSLPPDPARDAALAGMAAAAQAYEADAAFAAEHAAWRAWSEAKARDDASQGRDIAEIAEAWAAAAAAHPDTVFGARAAARGRSVRWETGVYP